MAFIYGFRAKDSQLYFYIGSTKHSVEYRFKQHRDYIQAGYNKNKHFVSKVKKLGWDNIIVDTLAECDELSRWDIEDKWIKKLRNQGHPLTNLVHNSDFLTSHYMDKETDYENFKLERRHIDAMITLQKGEMLPNGNALHDALLEWLYKIMKHLETNYPEDLKKTIEIYYPDGG